MKQIIFLLLALTLLFSCEKDEVKTISNPLLETEEPNEECIEYRITYAIEIDAPATGTVNTPIEIDVSYHLTSGCGNFEKFIKEVDGNTHSIQVETKYVGCNCTMINPKVTTPFIFEKNTPGIYSFKFKSGVSSYIEVDVEIN